MRKEITEAQITELMQAIPRAEEVDRLRADRRERIATAALQGLLSEGDLRGEPQIWAKRATVFADALIAELDKEKRKP